MPVNPPVLCAEQLTVRPQIGMSVDGAPVLTRLQAVSVSVGQAAIVEYTLRSQAGDVVDLTACTGAGATVKVRIREATLLDRRNDPVEILCTIVNPPGADGLVQALLTDEVVAFPGISNMEFALLDATDKVIFTNFIYLIVNRGQWGTDIQDTGPPTLSEIRLHLRDSAPEDNLWLGINEFDLGEIASCIERPILYFNESRPPLNLRYSTASFPYRYYWLEGIIGCLYQMGSLHYSRVHLAYQQQGGLQVDDKNKAEAYAALGKERWDSYKDWVLRTKVGLNAQGCFQTIGSPYYGSVWRN